MSQDPMGTEGPTVVQKERSSNTTLDEGVLLEQIRKLKNSKSGYIGQLTKLYQDVEQLIASSLATTGELNLYFEKISVAFDRFQHAHLEYCQCLETKPELKDEALNLYDEQLRRKFNTEDKLHQWLKEVSEKNSFEFEIRPEDSISRVSSRRNSRSNVSSAASSASSSEIRRVRAKQAVARLKMRQLKQQQELIKQEEEMKKRREMFEVQNEIDQADLEARMYEDAIEDAEAREENKCMVSGSKLNPEARSWPIYQNGVDQIVQTKPNPTAKIGGLHSSDQGNINPLMSTTRQEFVLPTTGIDNCSPIPLMHTDKNDLHNLAATIRQGFALPKPELAKFDGSPLQYWSFIRSFENNIERNTSDENEKLTYLMQYCTGDARKVIKSCVMMDPSDGYKAARRMLKERFGHPYTIATSFVKSVTDGAPIKPTDGAELLAFADQLKDCENTLEAIGYLDEINSADNLKRIVERLPYHLKAKWLDKAQALFEAGVRPRLRHISQFVMAKAKTANNPVFAGILRDEKNQGRDRKPQYKPGGKVNNFNIQGEEDGNNTPKYDEKLSPKFKENYTNGCPSCGGRHRLIHCKEFEKKSYTEKMKIVRMSKLCDNCFIAGHMAKGCMKGNACEVTGCNRKHNTLLHPPKQEQVERRPGDDPPGLPKKDNQRSENGNCNATNRGGGVRLRIVPVKVKGKNGDKVLETYAFLDNGSDVTLCDEKLVEELELDGTKRNFLLTTQEKRDSARKGLEVELKIEALDGSDTLDIQKVWTVNRLNVSQQSIATAEDIKKWPHLNDVELGSTENKEVRILIGSNVPEAFWVLEERRGKRGEPYAIRSPLGWTLIGPTLPIEDEESQYNVNFIRVGEENGSEEDILLRQVKSFWETDFGGSISDPKTAMSVQDKKALQMMEQSVELVSGHYQVGLPWRHHPPCIPNNRLLAVRRLGYLKRRLQKDQELFEKYKTSINEYIDKGYATRVPQDEVEQRDNVVCYLPHHPVFHPHKPGKVRVVFDCAAKYKGTSLNEQLLSGPDLTNSLVGVLTRFREEPVALVADIEGMFHQVRVKPEDHDALRFLWWPDDDMSKELIEYRMQVHLFGSTSSPSCASFCLRKTADDHKENFDEDVINTVKRNFYVDDCLKSTTTVEAAVNLASDLSELLAKGGFRLTKWISNKKEVIESIPENERAASVIDLDLDKDELPAERTLGVQWCVETDTFNFKIVAKEKPLTRRGILSTTSSVYDPLGLVAPAILPAKKLLQDLCRQNIGWDEEIGEGEQVRWTKWLSDLPELSKISVDRCIKPADFGEIKSAQLHHFADASQVAYGAVSYTRLTNVEGKVHCAFLFGKSRLAHIKPMTVPRLELCAAVVAIQMDQMLRQELDLKIEESVFWTDSMSVLQYIRNESTRFHTFVANRLAVIHDGSLPSQWRYVNTNLNPADDASRGLSASQMVVNERWLKGPKFLWDGESTWPKESSSTSSNVPVDDPEAKKEVQAHHTVGREEPQSLDVMINRYSSWYRLKRGVAWLLRFKEYLLEKRSPTTNEKTYASGWSSSCELTLEEVKVAEKKLIMYVQRQTFSEVISTLQDLNVGESTVDKPRALRKSGSIYKLSPSLDKEGLLRVGGRLENAPIEYDEKHQLILPNRHRLTELIVSEEHELMGHVGKEHVLSGLRRSYWIVKGRAAVRRVIGTCFACKRRNARRMDQVMANLPQDRVSPDNPPFTYVGIDYFGPISVRQRRSQVKRYGCLFTCLTVRAVHIEIADSLDTDAFLNALRRFISRRGHPKIIRSDNGTNFCAGERELREAIGHWNQRKIGNYLQQRNVKWIFNPPAAPHMGGVWERMVQSTKKILKALVKEQVLTDESLRTLVTEVEGILNSRPLTSNNDHPNDLEPLTPNDLLLFRSNKNIPPGVFSKTDNYCKRRWRQVQYLTNLFWKRWLKEYLPTLQQKGKWTQVKRNLAPGDLVLVAEDNVHRGQWPLGRVIEVYFGKDGYARSAKIKTRSTQLVRPISKLCFLESTNPSQEQKS